LHFRQNKEFNSVFEKPQFGQITQFQVTNIEGLGGGKHPAFGIFENLLLK